VGVVRTVSRWGVAELTDALAGAVDVELGSDGVGDWCQPWRLPTADLELHHPALTLSAMCPSGVRLRLRTASRQVRLEADQVLLVAGLPAFEAPYDLLVDGVPAQRGSVRPVPDGVEFLGLPAGDKALEIWLPILPGIRIRGLRALDGLPLLPAPADRRPRWTVYGSSITHGWDTSPARTWPAVAARILGRSVTNLGYSGACLLDPLVARVIAEQPTEHIALEIGINIHNTAALRSRTLLPVLHGFLATIRSRRAHVPITVIGPVFGGAREESVVACGQEEVWEVSGDLTLGEIRGLLREAVRLLRKRGDTARTWIDGRQLFGAADAAAGGLPDGLHPDAAGQLRMGERFAVLQSGFGAGANSGQWAPRQSSESVRNQSGSRKGH